LNFDDWQGTGCGSGGWSVFDEILPGVIKMKAISKAID
jgi:hypothetical protein